MTVPFPAAFPCSVPLIFTTALIFLSPVSIASYVPPAAAKLLGSIGVPLTDALLAAVAYAAFYLYIAPIGLGASMAALVFAQLAVATYLYNTYGSLSTFMPAAIGVHIVAWIAQFYGHGVHEGRAPALLDNLFQVSWMPTARQPLHQPVLAAFSRLHHVRQCLRYAHTSAPSPLLLLLLLQAIFMAPLFVFIEVLFKLGLLIEFKAEAMAIVEAKIAEFRAAKAKSS